MLGSRSHPRPGLEEARARQARERAASSQAVRSMQVFSEPEGDAVPAGGPSASAAPEEGRVPEEEAAPEPAPKPAPRAVQKPKLMSLVNSGFGSEDFGPGEDLEDEDAPELASEPSWQDDMELLRKSYDDLSPKKLDEAQARAAAARPSKPPAAEGKAPAASDVRPKAATGASSFAMPGHSRTGSFGSSKVSSIINKALGEDSDDDFSFEDRPAVDAEASMASGVSDEFDF